MPTKNRRSKSARTVRALKAAEPQLIEGNKRLLCIRGPATSAVGVELLHDFVRNVAIARAGRILRTPATPFWRARERAATVLTLPIHCLAPLSPTRRRS